MYTWKIIWFQIYCIHAVSSLNFTWTSLDESDLLADLSSCFACDVEGRLENEPLVSTFFNRWCRFFRFVPLKDEPAAVDAPEGTVKQIEVGE